MPKVLITGGLGFIFSHVTQYLVKKGYEVVVLDNKSVGSHPEIEDGSFKFLYADLSHAYSKDFIIRENPDYIIHASAYSDVDFSIKEPQEVFNTNNASTVNVFEASRKCTNLKKLVYISTDEVYGECEHKKREDAILFPKNPYACSKAFGSLLRLAYDNTYPELKDKTAETRFCNVFGERQDNRKIMSAIKESIEQGRVLPVHNGGLGSREYIYVGNIPEVVELVMLKGDRTYNVTLNNSYTVLELIKKVEDLTGKKVTTIPSERKGMDMKYQMDNSRILELGWKPKYSFEEGIRKYLNA